MKEYKEGRGKREKYPNKGKMQKGCFKRKMDINN